MGLWGATDADESKPKHLSTAEKKNVFATTAGWVRKASDNGCDNPLADPEVLVAIGDLSTSIGAADITHIEFVTTSYSEAAPGAFSTLVRFNERVTVTGTPRVQCLNDQAGGGTIAAFKGNYASGSGTHELTFTSTLGAGELAENDVISIGANAMELNSGTVIDTADGTTNATITSSAGIGSAAGTITVAA